MGVTMNLNPALVAGAIISGGIFGDKLSPLSETNNLASAVVDTDLLRTLNISYGARYRPGSFH